MCAYYYTLCGTSLACMPPTHISVPGSSVEPSSTPSDYEGVPVSGRSACQIEESETKNPLEKTVVSVDWPKKAAHRKHFMLEFCLVSHKARGFLATWSEDRRQCCNESEGTLQVTKRHARPLRSSRFIDAVIRDEGLTILVPWCEFDSRWPERFEELTFFE
jgi:hypothetical protein